VVVPIEIAGPFHVTGRQSAVLGRRAELFAARPPTSPDGWEFPALLGPAGARDWWMSWKAWKKRAEGTSQAPLAVAAAAAAAASEGH
jgi:hypothetical protein